MCPDFIDCDSGGDGQCAQNKISHKSTGGEEERKTWQHTQMVCRCDGACVQHRTYV